MNKIFNITVILAFLFFLPSTHQFNCPLNDELKPVDGTYADPDNCGVYYHCINGTSYPQQCPPTLFFTVTLTNCQYQTCVESEEADCPGGVPNEISRTEATECRARKNAKDIPNQFGELCFEKNTDCEGKENGTFPNQNDCRQYYHCYNGVAWPQQCPPGFFFNPDLNVRDCVTKMCVPFEEANCPIDGGWTEWTGWSGCEPDCGDGLRVRTRSCSNPPPSNGGLDCPGNSVDLDLCAGDPCGSANQPAFMVSLIQRSRLSNVMNWQKVNYDYGDLFDSATNTMKVNESGFYYMSVSAQSASANTIYLYMERTGKDSVLYSQSVTDGGIKARSAMYSLTPLFSPRIRQSSACTFLSSEDGVETSWLGFRYDTNNVLYTGRANHYSTIGLVPMSGIMTLRGIGLQADRKLFTLSTQGWYFVQFSTGIYARQSVKLSLSIEGSEEDRKYALSRGHRMYTSNDIFSRGVIVQLDAMDKIGLYLETGRVRSLSNYNSLTVFRLNVTQDNPAFFAYRNSSMIINRETRIAYDNVVVDSASGWDDKDNAYKVVTKGLYYIDVSLGVYPRAQLIVTVKVNNEKKLRLQYLRTNHDMHDMISRAGLLELNEGDLVSIEALSSVYSDDSRVTAVTMYYVSS